jgi:hypothetical protein
MFRVLIAIILIGSTISSHVRQCFANSLAVAFLGSGITPCLAASSSLSGVVSLPESIIPITGEKTALYVTVKQDLGIWKSGVLNVKSPPVLTKRISPISNFPIEFSLDEEEDSTPEGIATAKDWKSGNNPLLISVRLDSDGVAATRSPEDLVGQGSVSLVNSNWERAEISLQGRGVAGKFITESRN